MTYQVEVVTVQIERLAHLLDLIDEPFDVPEVRIVRLVAVRGAQLVVVVILDACRGEVAVAGLPVLVSRGRPAMEEQHPCLRVVADAFGPDLEVAFGRRDRDHPDAAGDHVVAAGVVEVTSFSLCQAASPLSATVSY